MATTRRTRLNRAKKRAAKAPGGKGPVRNRPAGVKIFGSKKKTTRKRARSSKKTRVTIGSKPFRFS